MQNLYEAIFYSKKVNQLFTNEAIVGAMLRFESALADAQGQLDIIPKSAANIISKNCAVDQIDIDKLIEDAAAGGNINIPLIKQLTALVRNENESASKFVHFGATSQDVIDTAMMLQAKEAVAIITSDLNKLIEKLVALTREHRETMMVGRSFMQHARPINFSYKTAGWLNTLINSKDAIDVLSQHGFLLQLGGAVGTLSAMQDKGMELGEAICEELGLKMPVKPWHTERDKIASIATTLGILAGNLSKIAKDISLLSQTEIGELRENPGNGKGGSSTMPNKSNPVNSILILANTHRIPASVSTILAGMSQEHERGTGTWHAEWETLISIIELTAGATGKAAELFDRLEVDKQQMLHNLELSNGLVYAENISFALAPLIGKSESHEIVEHCCKEALAKKTHLKEICKSNAIISKHLNNETLAKLFDPASSLGMSDIFIDGVLRRNF